MLATELLGRQRIINDNISLLKYYAVGELSLIHISLSFIVKTIYMFAKLEVSGILIDRQDCFMINLITISL